MGTNRGVLYLLPALVLVFTVSCILPLISTDLGPAAVWAQEEEEEEILPKGGEDRPNPMERSVDTSTPAMKPGSLILPAVQSGRPEMPSGQSGGAELPFMENQPASPDPGTGSGVRTEIVSLKGGKQGMMEEDPAGKMQFFFLQGNSKVLAPDGTYQTRNGQQITVSGGQASMPIDPIEHGGAMQSPGQMQMPGKMR